MLPSLLVEEQMTHFPEALEEDGWPSIKTIAVPKCFLTVSRISYSILLIWRYLLALPSLSVEEQMTHLLEALEE